MATDNTMPVTCYDCDWKGRREPNEAWARHCDSVPDEEFNPWDICDAGWFGTCPGCGSEDGLHLDTVAVADEVAACGAR